MLNFKLKLLFIITILLIIYWILKYKLYLGILLFKKKKFPDERNEFNFPIKPNDSTHNIVRISKASLITLLKMAFFGFEKTSELGYINYLFNKYNSPTMISESKIYWYFFCKKHKINHPKLYFIKQNNIVYEFNKINTNNYYIKKPLLGIQGKDIEKISGRNVRNILRSQDDILIQEMLYDKYSKSRARHFRLISSFDGEVMFLYELSTNDSIRSNAANGANVNDITSQYLYNKTHLSKHEYQKIQKMTNKLLNIHKEYLPHLFSIGWDIMFGNNETYLLEGNVYGHSVILGECDKNLIKNYLNKSDIFYKNLN